MLIKYSWKRKLLLLLPLIFIVLLITYEKPFIFQGTVKLTWNDQSQSEQSSPICHSPKRGYLNIHLIPHTHDDVGWLKTVDQYYYGSKSYIQRAGVQYILDSVVQALAADPTRKFTYVEMAFFSRWWAHQSLRTRELVSQLVQSGQLQFALGGWSMNDEASVHYADAIDQLTKGRDLLKRLFGPMGIPRVAWQIDAFGHSRDHAQVFQDAGFEAVYFQRMDYREKNERIRSKQLELIWDTGLNFTHDKPGLFTGIFHGSYCYPRSFCFDDKCPDDGIRDDPNLHDYNADRRVDEFLSYIDSIKPAFATNQIMVLMGCDFTYENANMNFKNTDKLIFHVNKRQETSGSKVNLLYSTPYCYTKAVNEDFKNLNKIPRRGGDFFPYATDFDAYWTGYYTSRIGLKGYVRETSNLLTMCEQIHLFSDRVSKVNEQDGQYGTDNLVDSLRETLGVLQHHDAITGTEKQHVANDYALRLAKNSGFCHNLINNSFFKLIPSIKSFAGDLKLTFCDLRNISICDATEGYQTYRSNASQSGGVYMALYNPTGWQLTSHWVRLPISVPQEEIGTIRVHLIDLRSANSQNLPYQLIPVSQRTQSIPERKRKSDKANYELVFNAVSSGVPLPPVGFGLYYLALEKQSYYSRNHDSSLQNECSTRYYKLRQVSKKYQYSLVNSSPRDSVVLMIENLETGVKTPVMMEMMYYFGEVMGRQASGAYVFLPARGTNITRFSSPSSESVTGPCFEEIQLTYAPWASATIRLYTDGEIIVEWTGGPIPDDYGSTSRELVIRYTIKDAKMDNPGEFFTDSAGRRLIRRVRNRRVDWNLAYNFSETQPISGNYYPIVNRILLKGLRTHNRTDQINSEPMAFAVYTDRPHGATSLNDGQIEIMLHRRLVRDDGYGVAEALMENGVDGKGLIVRGQHRLRFDDQQVIEQEDQQTAHMWTRSPIPVFMHAKRQAQPNQIHSWTGLNFDLPKHIHLLSLISWPLNRNNIDPGTPNQILLRLEYLLSNTSSDTNKPFIFDVSKQFHGIRVTRAVEVVITADQLKYLAKSNRFEWPTEARIKQDLPDRKNILESEPSRLELTIQPGTIGSFILDYDS